MSDMDFKKRPESKAKGRYKSRIPEGTSIFPISLQIKRGDGKFEYGSLGTGFFVSKFGLFLTAKHVVEDQLHYQNGNGLEAWVVIKNKNYACPIKNSTSYFCGYRIRFYSATR
jgi:S1-C subfamily serine protease